MLFPTLDFAVFFLVVFALAWAMRTMASARKSLLLAASYVFYGYWDWRFCFLLLAASLIAWVAGLAIDRTDGERQRRAVVGASVGLLLVILGFFKYYGFFLESLGDVLRQLGVARDLPLMAVILPVGISFFTFQAISYIVDVYRREIPAQRSPLDLLLYVSFFPQLVAGPIVRARDFLPQLDERPRLTRFMLSYGLVLIVVGLLKKMVVANWLATHLVDDVFLVPDAHDTPTLLLAAYGYAVQIYCDFSGYSDMAIGTAALLGYHFRENFRQPYRAASLQEFWRRWHISLSEWLRDYLYKPLGGSRNGKLATYRNLFLTMFLGGLWHGAAYNFAIWGAMHGAALGLERAVRERLSPRHGSSPDAAFRRIARSPRPWHGHGIVRVLAVLATFHFVTLAWIFFRSADLQTALAYLSGLMAASGGFAAWTPFHLLLVFLPLAFHFTPHDLDLRCGRAIRRWPTALTALAFAFALVVIQWISPAGTAPFIYFQF
ncbi:MBOAT family protein [Aurantimonas sp. 22II-16-19i]|uniref:MBOAT family O-acyltransferase n=1 Tax=Aurantimonas sp. 22II-16-19i TaxID=1317114 RepID=UPI0009F7F1AF|nr:MBOAT family protein [Aurantimonas sp. 22II-16-19i]ORE98976.1 membrane bound O-acyl transferase MBOAT family protein [Aurantimonas sp. 22II-16-19i]